jgi:hypothetical protein
MTKWEYCEVRSYSESYEIIYSTEQGSRVEKIDYKSRMFGRGNELDVRAKLLAKLGKDGWELVDASYMMIFKRPIVE